MPRAFIYFATLQPELGIFRISLLDLGLKVILIMRLIVCTYFIWFTTEYILLVYYGLPIFSLCIIVFGSGNWFLRSQSFYGKLVFSLRWQPLIADPV